MTSKYLVKFYLRTLLIGTIISTVISLFVEYENVTSYLFRGEIGEFLAGVVWFITFGLLIATISQVIFFIYLFVHPLGVGIFRRLWPYVQLLIIMYAIFDLFYLRFYRVGLDTGHMWSYLGIPVIIIAAGVLVARHKMKITGDRNIFIPSLFFMIVMTSITMIPFIFVEDTSWIARSVFAIIVMNAFQLIMMPKYIEASEKEKIERGRVTKSDRNKERKKEEQEAADKERAKEESQVKTRNKLNYKNKTKIAKNNSKK
ncbi:KinB-signaling pathway activation protein [Corticicoccus populi]|uniref:KinB-signaling pathway activation protein n=1 Tax=Corticicoccus populi TaxID=1812821 RepID=A0ABW5WV86_9STAP